MLKITIIIPCYNCEKYIKKCVESILNQTYQNIEIILINDGSTDNTDAVINLIMENTTNIVYINKENTGVSDTRNVGINEATGDYIMFIDSDDFIEHNYINEFVKGAKDNPDLIVGGFTYILNDGLKEQISGIQFEMISKENYLDKYYLDSITKRIHFGPINKLYKRTLLQDKKIRFRKDISIREDGIFVLDYLDVCSTISGIKNCGYYYVQQIEGTSLVSKFNNNELKINSLYFKKILQFLSNEKDSKVIRNIFPIFLNMDYSSIKKFYLSKDYNFIKGILYIFKVKKDSTYRYARNALFKENIRLSLKYYRPILLIHIINCRKKYFILNKDCK